MRDSGFIFSNIHVRFLWLYLLFVIIFQNRRLFALLVIFVWLLNQMRVNRSQWFYIWMLNLLDLRRVDTVYTNYFYLVFTFLSFLFLTRFNKLWLILNLLFRCNPRLLMYWLINNFINRGFFFMNFLWNFNWVRLLWNSFIFNLFMSLFAFCRVLNRFILHKVGFRLQKIVWFLRTLSLISFDWFSNWMMAFHTLLNI